VEEIKSLVSKEQVNLLFILEVSRICKAGGVKKCREKGHIFPGAFREVSSRQTAFVEGAIKEGQTGMETRSLSRDKRFSQISTVTSTVWKAKTGVFANMGAAGEWRGIAGSLFRSG